MSEEPNSNQLDVVDELIIVSQWLLDTFGQDLDGKDLRTKMDLAESRSNEHAKPIERIR